MEKSKEIYLKTDFEDYYDEFLIGKKNKNDYSYYRKRNVLDKKLTLEYLKEKFGYVIPEVFHLSKVQEESFSGNPKIIVFDKNKQSIKPIKSALRYDKNKYGRVLIKGNKTSSFLIYKVGAKKITVYQESDHGYKSCLGNSRQTILSIEEVCTSKDEVRPIYSMEFIERDGVKYLVDYDEAPKLENSIISKELSKEIVYEQLLMWFRSKNG